MATTGLRVLAWWQRLAPLPGGARIFSWLLGWFVPYSGSIGARVVRLAPGASVVQLHDRRALRNHFGSVHAVALANLAELASGLAVTALLPAHVRGIPVHLAMDYVKKARGTLTATASVTLPTLGAEPVEHDFESTIVDASGDVVARGTVRWRLSARS